MRQAMRTSCQNMRNSRCASFSSLYLSSYLLSSSLPLLSMSLSRYFFGNLPFVCCLPSFPFSRIFFSSRGYSLRVRYTLRGEQHLTFKSTVSRLLMSLDCRHVKDIYVFFSFLFFTQFLA